MRCVLVGGMEFETRIKFERLLSGAKETLATYEFSANIEVEV